MCRWHRIAFLGHRVREVLGFAAARSHRLRLADFERLVHPADLAGFRRHLAAIERAAEGEILSQELRIKGADGHYRWLRSRDTVLARTESGAVSKVVGVVTNIDQTRRRTGPAGGRRPPGRYSRNHRRLLHRARPALSHRRYEREGREPG